MHSLGYLLSGPEYEKFADPSSKEDVYRTHASCPPAT